MIKMELPSIAFLFLCKYIAKSAGNKIEEWHYR